MTGLQVLLLLLSVVAATYAQVLTGFAFVLVLLGLAGALELASLPDLANVATVLSLLSAVVTLRGADMRYDASALRNTAIGGLVGIVAGVMLLSWLSTNVVVVLRLALGITIMGCAVSMLLPSAAKAQLSGAAGFRAVGALSGLLTGLFATGGPPLVYYYYRQPMPANTIRATLLAILAVMSAVRLAVTVAAGEFSVLALELSVLTAPAALAASWLLRARPPGWSPRVVLVAVCALLLMMGAAIALPAARAGWALAAS